MNVYRNIVSDSGNAGFGGIAVNGEPLAGPVVDNDEWRNFERSIVAMMCYEYGRDVAHHPVHYCLLFNDLLPRWADDGDNDEYAWELTSDDLQRAVSRAKDRLANNSESDLFAAVLSLRPVLLESLIMLGLEPGYLTYKRLLDWYDDDNVHHRNRQSRLEILRLMLKHGLDPCFKPRDWEGESLLHFMCGSCTPEEDIGLLLAAGASEAIHNRDLSDNTPLHRYAMRDFHHRRCPPTQAGFDLLLEYGAEITARNGQGKTVVQLLLGDGDKPQKYRARRRALAEYLVDRGA